MKNLTINIQLNEADTAPDIGRLVTEIIDEVNGMGYGVMSALVDGVVAYSIENQCSKHFLK